MARIARMKKRDPRVSEHDTIQSIVSEIRYDFKTRHGELLLPVDSVPGNACIRKFIAIDPKVISAFVYTGEILDMFFIRKENKMYKKNPKEVDFIYFCFDHKTKATSGKRIYRGLIKSTIQTKIDTGDYDAV